MFQVFRQKHAFPGLPDLDCTQFEPAIPRSGQRRLF
jgi:hypothetical protein